MTLEGEKSISLEWIQGRMEKEVQAELSFKEFYCKGSREMRQQLKEGEIFLR